MSECLPVSRLDLVPHTKRQDSYRVLCRVEDVRFSLLKRESWVVDAPVGVLPNVTNPAGAKKAGTTAAGCLCCRVDLVTFLILWSSRIIIFSNCSE
eukprot:scaffold151220_cov56-Attheya_sp.AAC.3